jgi:uncharacterized alpha-E superfamily protein
MQDRSRETIEAILVDDLTWLLKYEERASKYARDEKLIDALKTVLKQYEKVKVKTE